MLRIGLIGSGVAGERHAAAIRAFPGCTLAAVFDTDSRRADGLGARFGAPAMAFEATLEASDAIIIATPASTHGGYALAALERGLHVLVERPIATSRAEASSMQAMAAAKNLILQVGHREKPILGSIGLWPAPSGLRMFEAVREAPPREHVGDVSVILDLMIQDLFVAVCLFQARPVSVLATKLGGRGATIDAASARIRFKGGGEARLRAARTATVRTTNWSLDIGQSQMNVDFVRGSVSHTKSWPNPKPYLAQDEDPVAQNLSLFIDACTSPYRPNDLSDVIAALDLGLHIETIISSNL